MGAHLFSEFMKAGNHKAIILTSWLFALCFTTLAHPTGNMICHGESILWPYIYPIDDPNHHACVMIWTKSEEAKVYLKSEFAGSDFMLYSNQKEIYLIERRFIQEKLEFQVRILKTQLNKEAEVIWNWFTDTHRIGEGGFFMLSDEEIVFAKYPRIYRLKKGEKDPSPYFNFLHPIVKIRAVEDQQILLLADSACYLVQQNGKLIKKWDNLIDLKVKEAPLNRNQVFDADYYQGALLIAYWGRRTFDLIDTEGNRTVLLQENAPFTPHWVAFWKAKKLLFSSQLIFNGSTPKPFLSLFNEGNQLEVIWKKP